MVTEGVLKMSYEVFTHSECTHKDKLGVQKFSLAARERAPQVRPLVFFYIFGRRYM